MALRNILFGLIGAIVLVVSGCDSDSTRSPSSSHKPEDPAKAERRMSAVGDYSEAGFVALQRGDYRKAVSHFREAIRLRPDMPGLYNNLGRSLYLLGEYDEALKVYTAAHRMQPKNATLKANIGDVFRQRGRYIEAVQYYNDALQIDPTLARVHYDLGNLYLKQGKYTFAESRLKKVLQLDENFHRARLALIITYHLSYRDRIAWKQILKLEEFGYEVKQSLRSAVLKGMRTEGRQERFRPGI